MRLFVVLIVFLTILLLVGTTQVRAQSESGASQAPCTPSTSNTSTPGLPFNILSPKDNLLLYLITLFATGSRGSSEPCSPSTGNAQIGLHEDIIPPEYRGTTPPSCQPKVEAAVNNLLDNNEDLLKVYLHGQEKTGTPWEILAAIHFIENGNGRDGSLVSGHSIGFNEADVVLALGSDIRAVEAKCNKDYSVGPLKYLGNGKCGFASIEDSAVYAGNTYKTKKSLMPKLNEANNFNLTQNTDFKLSAGAFAGYNSQFHNMCQIENQSKYPFIFTNTPRPGASSHLCRPEYVGYDHVYATSCLDDKHTNMQFCYNGSCRQWSKPGAIAFIRELQSQIKKRSIIVDDSPSGSPGDISNINAPPSGSFTYYNQCDSAYKLSEFGSCANSQGALTPKFCSCGCGPTSVAQVLATYVSRDITPLTVGRAYIKSGNWSCAGSNIAAHKVFLDKFSDKIEVGPRTGVPYAGGSQGNLTEFGKFVKGKFDDTWTFQARAETKVTNERTGSERFVAHHLWVIKVDSDYNVWANDPYWSTSRFMGSGKEAPINLTAFVNGKYPTKSVRYYKITSFIPVRRKQ